MAYLGDNWFEVLSIQMGDFSSSYQQNNFNLLHQTDKNVFKFYFRRGLDTVRHM